MADMKTILIPMESYDVRSALETALLLARRCNSYMEGFAVRWQISEIPGIDLLGDLPLEHYNRAIAEGATKARHIFETFMHEHNVPRSTGTTGSFSFGWLSDVPAGENFVGSYGRVFDVIVMNRPHENSPGLYDRAIESSLFESGRPVLLSPPSPPQGLATNVLISWNCSAEQAETIALSIPLLQKADRVTVLSVVGGTEVPGPSAEQLIRYLQRNSIRAALRTVELNGRSTGEVILATAESLRCDLLIKGAYTVSRLRQIMFGGATQHILANATLPVLLAH
jgi:nucleotide-binding universal stress UspA family protein